MDNKQVLITEGIYQGCIGELVKDMNDGRCLVILEGEVLSRYFPVDHIDYIDSECYIEMATTFRSQEMNIKITVNPDRRRLGNPYFKVFNSCDTRPGNRKTKVCRLHFFDSEMEYHIGDGYLDWKINNSDVKNILKILKSNHPDHESITVWQYTCFKWNEEFEFVFSNQLSQYINGDFDEKYKDNPSYIPSSIDIPSKWIYDPPKNKNKK